MPLSAPEYWLEWAKNYFRCQFTYVGELIHKETWSAASFGWAEGLQTINPPIYRLTTAVSDIDQTNINRDIRDGNWLSIQNHLFIVQINFNFKHVRIERYHRRSCIGSARNKSIETGCKEQIADTQGGVLDGLENWKLIDFDMERWVARLK